MFLHIRLFWCEKDHVTLKTGVMMLKIFKYLFKYSNRKVVIAIICFCCMFDQINSALMRIRDFYLFIFL